MANTRLENIGLGFKNINLSLRSASINGERLPFYRQTSHNEEKAPLNLVAETPMAYRYSQKQKGFRWQGKWYECSTEEVKALGAILYSKWTT